ncbi:unnamed protein product [Toxocara canis]|uniref:Transmembrane protein n=1 Tax=Toxocara canis TaxID=6265 RepID=A0A183UN64_TOXCA|nr:unnamed protein product [Toxocara canis]
MRVFSRERNEEEEDLEKSLRKLLIVTRSAFRPHGCCLGCVSIHDAAFFIGVAELFVIGKQQNSSSCMRLHRHDAPALAAFFTLFLAKLIIDDGRIFYTKELEGRGADLARLMIFSVALSILVIVLLLIGVAQRQRFLLLPHIAWQCGLLVCSVYIIYAIAIRATPIGQKRMAHQIPLPSAIVLCTVVSSMTLTHIWWMGIVIVAMVRMRKSTVKLIEVTNTECPQLQRLTKEIAHSTH